MVINNIPQKWSIKKLRDVLVLLKDGTHGTHKDCDQGKFLLSAKDVIDGRVLCSEDSRIISDEDFNSIHARYKLQNRDIVLTIVGTVGRSAMINNYNQEYTFQRSVAILRPSEFILPEFLHAQIQSTSFQNELKKRQSVSAQPGVYLEDLGSVLCVVPPIKEQKKIAEILGTWDRAIEELTDLITEKKELKRGLMQRLLTGIQRLPRFTKPWKKIKLHDVAEISKGTQLNRLNMLEEGFPVYNGGMTESGFTNEYNNDAYTIIISEGGNSCGFVNFIKTKFWAGGHCYTVICHDCVNKSFLYQLLKYNENKLMNLRVGSGLPNIQQKALNKFSLLLPDDFTEQKAIADVLSRADSEIDLLNQQLDLLKEQKRGLMQKLLTGEIRVKVDTETC